MPFLTASVFIVLEALVALTMLAMSVHGVDGQAIAAPIYFVVAAGLTLWIARRTRRSIAVVGGGVLALLAAPGVIGVLGYAERIAYDRRIAATQVTNVKDEPILSAASGRTIGVRLTYDVTVPRPGYFGILPNLSAPGPRNERLRLDSKRWTVDGSVEPVRFEPGRRHAVMVELYPPILFVSRDKRCVQSSSAPPLPEFAESAPLRVSISESTYGNAYHGGADEVTRRSYDLAELYRAVMAEGLPGC